MKYWYLLIFSFMLLNMISSCEKNRFENKRTLKKLYKLYKDGEIDECKYNGQTVYNAELNAYDAGMTIYDKDGKILGSCSFAWGTFDSICSKLTDCETIYRSEGNIWGQPAVDKYGLGK